MNKTHKSDAQIKEDILNFIAANGHEPTAIDFDNNESLPSARTIQRRFGGLPALRKELGLKTEDFTKGKARSKKAKASMTKSTTFETELFIELLNKYGHDRVSSPVRVFLNSGKTLDFKIEKDGIIYLIDVFYANSVESFKGCVAIKNRKYNVDAPSFYCVPIQILLVSANDKVVVPTTSKIPVLSLSEFRAQFI